ncbi:MAG TPA: hypothetical protein VKA49_15475 [Flavitalea sp.]|nr:hypothetical protein [Flavitalea sp.]
MKVAFTIATANFLAQAKTVGDSFLAHHPGDKFCIALLDKLHDKVDKSFFGPIEIIEIETIGIPFFEEMVNRYSIFELSNSLKPFCAEFLLDHFKNVGVLIYLDSDVFIYHNMNELDYLLSRYNIIISPHFFTPLPADGIKQNERHFLNSGLYNGGFFAISKNSEASRFLSWWKERMRTLCFVDVAKGLFVDQIWLNYVPLYFKGVHLIEHSGFNVAYWNLHERRISKKDRQYIVNDSHPLVFYHFSGYNVERTEVLARYQHRYTFDNRKELVPLFEDYRNTLLNNKYIELSRLVCLYNSNKGKAKPVQTSRVSRIFKRIKRTLRFLRFRTTG